MQPNDKQQLEYEGFCEFAPGSAVKKLFQGKSSAALGKRREVTPKEREHHESDKSKDIVDFAPKSFPSRDQHGRWYVGRDNIHNDPVSSAGSG